MESRLSRPALGAIGCALAGGGMFALGFSLEPVAWLMWIAPLPLLWLVGRVRLGTAILAAGATWTIAQSRIWWYLADVVETPVVLLAVSGLLTTGLYVGVTCLYRALVVRRRFWLACGSFPAGVVGVEFAVAKLNAEAGGEWWSFAYTQADQTAVMQLVSATGIWGLTFLLMAVPAAVAVATAPGIERRPRALVVGAAMACLAIALGYGLIRPEAAGATIRAGALALPAGEDSIHLDTAEADDMMADYRAEITALGAREDLDVLVLPEKLFYVTAEERGPHLDHWSELAAESGVDLVVGLALETHDEVHNVAVWIPADGSDTAVYRKQHLIPGLEDWITPSEAGPVAVPGSEGRWAMTICKDLDYAGTIAEYGDAGTGLMLAPSLDFEVDGWWHGRVAVTRGVEQGFSMVRAGQWGLVTVSDQYGDILAEDERLAVAEVSTEQVDTLYNRFGDWFLWPVFAILALGLAASVRRPARDLERAGAGSYEPAPAVRERTRS
ncbi:nitrilase-related carbon-nitrogen hydrolase [Glycomyces salinus]|uniref:nitrilase-related carbon-nitrogen hydrolase n=1 Tax=Glycomyces salinus TaxID=980294 RepID=UPI0018EB3D1A|nr:nitrilase-related carbon-nitrogen hydrolase [Glycomyces salinus]